MTRKSDFQKVQEAISSFIWFSNTKAILAKGDSLDILKFLPDKTISLILTDPPYHSTKKQNVYGDKLFKKDNEYLEWMSRFAIEWRRILKPNGCFFCFCSPAMAARLEVMFSKSFNILSQIVWTKPNDPGFDGWKQKMNKEALRQWYQHTERIIFGEPAYDGNLHRSYFGVYLREMRKKAELTPLQLTEAIGAYGRINHGGAVSNWESGRNIPSPDQYRRICRALTEGGKVKSMLPYEDVIRRFKVNSSQEFTDVWTFSSVRPYKGKHPAEKPLLLLEHAIEATTYPNDIVLDCFAGSGNTALAATRLNRFSISIEIDGKWANSIAEKLESATDNKDMTSSHVHEIEGSKKKQLSFQRSLF